MSASLLFIDADPSIYSNLRRGLVQDGYRVSLAEPGLGAIRKMLAEPPDLVILSVNCLTGNWEFCYRLLAFVDKPLLLLLSTSNPMDQVRGLELGADDCMIRPVSAIEFVARVRALLQRCQCPSRLANSSALSAFAAAGWFITTTSSPDNSACCRRKDSRTTLLMRFLAVARRQRFLEMARPSLAVSVSFRRYSTVNSVSRLRVAASNTRPKSAASSSRLSFVNRLRDVLVNPGLLLVVSTGAWPIRASAGRGLWRGGA